MEKMDAIPLNSEKFKMLSVNELTFLDSSAFLQGSLSSLVETLVKSNHQFDIVKEAGYSEKDLKLLLRKGVYPYDYVTDLSRLNDTNLPPRKEFYSKLKAENITRKDYSHACKVWKHFQCRNLSHYTKTYVASDVLLLAECVINLRNMIQKEFELDLANYLSLPMLAKDIMLKESQVKMELISDHEMINLIRKNIRGGLSYVNTRYCDLDKMKNLHPDEDFAILYADANNLVS